ncbi:MAG: PLD nuclease N-terminal domain-containing protein [Bacillota bacterium]|uniref:PLDc_N domain-containing protein n=1 Tax=Virgibacillus salarius TaxID=447199 RepID=A0A941DTT1_9BACI|nr:MULTISPECIES: PLD nuclease N-terminal domain-containing protein [Bacillaceae]NAZ07968.1 transcriptional regulator [Agaribacter marinus]MBR7795252.1 PLDc_N domain-containing protein [Virgibacillus salarius]MCC2251521.1 PLD nuclease N-terminal domain-containing protein [Virgibacillus sp. AGTR]MDY7045367.1 PLD nuclease N-terminal domain-containing protein [Virgibacillus sp. M23]QRZ19967.1 PLDc_N domain-containing protein [Virgibacillus sp. AGTR]
MQEMFESINWAVITPLLVIQGILLIIAIIDWAKVEKTNGPRWMWFFIIIFIYTIGPIAYFIFGRRQQ